MAYTTINKSSLHQNTILYTGTGSSNVLTGVGFQPDLTWTATRNEVEIRPINDSVNGISSYLRSNAGDTLETGQTQTITAQSSDGYTVGTEDRFNQSGNTFVSWNWKAGTTSGLSGGTITPSAYSINTTSGFGIYKYTGGSSTDTIAHGLGVAPKMIIIKSLTTTNDWTVYHESIGNAKLLVLNTTAAESSDATTWNSTSPTSTVWSMGNSGDVNNSARDYMAYAFAPKKGFSRCGSYTGNSNTDGPFVYTGFRPAFILLKNSTSSADWQLIDDKRLGYNVDNNRLKANSNQEEATTDYLDLLSNGFKIRSGSGDYNASGDTYVYMAFAEFPSVSSNNIPGLAR